MIASFQFAVGELYLFSVCILNFIFVSIAKNRTLSKQWWCSGSLLGTENWREVSGDQVKEEPPFGGQERVVPLSPAKHLPLTPLPGTALRCGSENTELAGTLYYLRALLGSCSLFCLCVLHRGRSGPLKSGQDLPTQQLSLSLPGL